MKNVYLMMKGEGYGKVVTVYENKGVATLAVNMYAATHLGMDITHIDCPPLDFDGALMRYGWADKCWWQKEVVY